MSWYTLTTERQTARLLDVGAALTHWVVRAATTEVDVVLGFDTVQDYDHAASTDNSHIGVVCGRYAGRLRNGRFPLPGGREVQVLTNKAGNCLHGGPEGWDKRRWTGVQHSDTSVTFTLTSPDGDQGFPGAAEAKVTYTLSDNEGLRIDFRVVALGPEPTPVNITSHAYFNLSGLRARDCLSTHTQVLADQYVPLDPESLCPIPQTPLLSVDGTVNDFRALRPMVEDHVDRATFAGYDVSLAVRGWANDGQLRHVAHFFEPSTGLAMDVMSTAPDAHLYTGYYLTGNLRAKAAHAAHAPTYGRFSGFCLELQHFPDAPNQVAFPNTILQPGEVLTQSTVYRVFPAV